jgi:hypothetical protein
MHLRPAEHSPNREPPQGGAPNFSLMAPCIARFGDGVIPSPTPGDEESRALWKASPPERRRAGSLAPPARRSGATGNYPPREARERGRQRRRTSSGRPTERGREDINLQSPLLEELRRATRWSSIVGRGCHSRSASPQIWPIVSALAPLLHGSTASQRESSHACTPLVTLPGAPPPHCSHSSSLFSTVGWERPRPRQLCHGDGVRGGSGGAPRSACDELMSLLPQPSCGGAPPAASRIFAHTIVERGVGRW